MATLVEKHLDERGEIDDQEKLLLQEYDTAEPLDTILRKLIRNTLDRHSWNISETARKLKTSRAQLRWKMQALGIDSGGQNQ
jgi:DNA-binding NtrC family response regulator